MESCVRNGNGCEKVDLVAGIWIPPNCLWELKAQKEAEECWLSWWPCCKWRSSRLVGSNQGENIIWGSSITELDALINPWEPGFGSSGMGGPGSPCLTCFPPCSSVVTELLQEQVECTGVIEATAGVSSGVTSLAETVSLWPGRQASWWLEHPAVVAYEFQAGPLDRYNFHSLFLTASDGNTTGKINECYCYFCTVALLLKQSRNARNENSFYCLL